jgi:hypothetical protein
LAKLLPGTQEYGFQKTAYHYPALVLKTKKALFQRPIVINGVGANFGDQKFA